MLVVSNTSPILNLALIGRLGLLRQQFQQVLIPDAVHEELRLDDPHPGNEAIRQALAAGWLRVGTLQNEHLKRVLEADLDTGEAAAIALAAELGAEWALLDEREGRLAAKRLGLPVTGVLGILLRAKISGSVPALRPEIEALRRDAGFRIREDLVQELLAEAGEE
jgi:predicted nucleic acid-binding protein